MNLTITKVKEYNGQTVYDFIKENVSIEQVAKLLNLNLTKSGHSLQGECPTNHPSTGRKCFSIHTKKNYFNCFSCGIGGDVTHLVEEVKKISSEQAIDWIIKEFNLEEKLNKEKINFRKLTDEEREEQKRENEKSQLYESAYEWMRSLLYDGTGQQELKYLTDLRMYDLDVLKKSEWCYFPEEKKIKEYLLSKFPEQSENIWQLPLIGFTKDKIKLALPYRNRNGNITGFMKRASKPEGITVEGKDGHIKLIRWDSTFGLDKTDLYNLDKCKDVENLLIVEGYPDAAYFHALGMNDITAIGQGILSEKHLEGLKQNKVKYVTIAFDNDEHGPSNSEKAVRLLLEKTCIIPYVLDPSEMKPHKDPDEFVKAEGLEAFKALLSKVQPGVYWLCERKANNIKDSNPITTKQTLDKCIEIALQCNDILEKNSVIKLIAKKFLLKEKDILQTIKMREKKKNITVYSELKVDENERFFPFIELGTDSFSYYDRIKDVVHLGVKERILENILYSGGQVMPDILPVLNAVFDVHTDERISLEKEIFNLFVPSKYMLLPKSNVLINPRRSFPHIYMLLGNLLPVYSERKLFLNWLAGILQTREKQLTAWVFKGEQGAGKGLLLNRILKHLFGRKQAIQVEDQQLQSQFNPWLQNKMLIAFNEVAHNNDTRNSIKSKIKAIITDSDIRINDKQIREFELTNYVNCLFFSNESVPVFIEDQDRRFNIIETGCNLDKMDFFNADPESFIASLEEEVPMFAQFLMNWNFDSNKAKKVINNAVKQNLISVGRTKFEELSKRLKTKDIDWLMDYMGGTYGSTSDNEKSLNEDIKLNRVKKETAREIFRRAFGHEASDTDLTKKLKLSGISPDRVTIDGKKQQFYIW